MDRGKATTTLSNATVNIIYDTRGVLTPAQMINFLKNVRGRRKAMEIAGYFTSNIPALVKQLKAIETNYYNRGKKGVKLDKDIDFIRKLYKRLGSSNDRCGLGKTTMTLSNATVNIIYDTRGVLTPAQMINFLKNVRGRRKAMEIAGYFASNIPALVKQLKAIETNYYNRGKKGVKLDEDIHFIRKLYKQLDTSDARCGNNNDCCFEKYYNESSYEARSPKGVGKKQVFAPTSVCKATTTLCTGTLNIISATRGVLSTSEMRNFLNQVHGRKKALEIARFFTSNITALVKQLKNVEADYYKRRKKCIRIDKDIDFIRRLHKRLESSNARSVNNEHCFCAEYHNEGADQARSPKRGRKKESFASASVNNRIPNETAKERSNSPHGMSYSASIMNYDTRGNNLDPDFASPSSYHGLPNEAAEEQSNTPQWTSYSTNVVKSDSTGNNFQPVFASPASYQGIANNVAEEQSNTPHWTNYSTNIINSDSTGNNFQPVFATTSSDDGIPNETEKERSNSPHGTSCSTNVPNFHTTGNDFDPDIASTSTCKATMTLSDGTLNIISDTRGVLSPTEMLEFLNQVRGKKKAMEIAHCFTSNIPALVEQLKNIEANLKKQERKCAGGDKDIGFIRRLHQRLESNDKHCIKNVDCFSKEYHNEGVYQARSPEGDRNNQVFPSTSVYQGTANNVTEEQPNTPQGTSYSTNIINSDSTGNNFQPVFATTLSGRARTTAGDGILNTISVTRGVLSPSEMRNFLFQVLTRKETMEIATSNISALVEQLKDIEANLKKQVRKCIMRDKFIDFIRRLYKRLDSNDDHSIKNEDCLYEEYPSEGAYEAKSPEGDRNNQVFASTSVYNGIPNETTKERSNIMNFDTTGNDYDPDFASTSSYKRKSATGAKMQSSGRKVSLSRATIKIISNTRGPLDSNQLCKFLKQVRFKKKATEIARDFTANIPALINQLQEVVTEYTRLRRKGVRMKKDFDFIRRLCIRLQEDINKDYATEGVTRETPTKQVIKIEYLTDNSSEEHSTDEGSSEEYSTSEDSENSSCVLIE